MRATLECNLGQHDGCASGGRSSKEWRSWCECPCHGRTERKAAAPRDIEAPSQFGSSGAGS